MTQSIRHQYFLCDRTNRDFHTDENAFNIYCKRLQDSTNILQTVSIYRLLRHDDAMNSSRKFNLDFGLSG